MRGSVPVCIMDNESVAFRRMRRRGGVGWYAAEGCQRTPRRARAARLRCNDVNDDPSACVFRTIVIADSAAS